MKLKDRYIGIVGILASLFLMTNIWNQSFQTKAFPMGILVILLALSVVLVVRKDTSGGYEITHFKRIIKGCVLLAAYIAGINILGWLSSTILFVGIFLWMYQCKMNKLVLIMFTIAYPVAIYILFKNILAVRLPSGILI